MSRDKRLKGIITELISEFVGFLGILNTDGVKVICCIVSISLIPVENKLSS
jgi:hypothetical protein